MTATKPAVVLVPGILSDGTWQRHYMEELQTNYHVVSYENKRFNKLYQLYKIPISILHRPLVDELYDKLLPLLDKETRPSILAHSFGTIIALKCLQTYSNVCLDSLILTGSIIKESFDWSTVLKDNRVWLVVNYYTPSDLWANISRQAFSLYDLMGGAGAVGFSCVHPRIINHRLSGSQHEGVTNKRRVPTAVAPWLPAGAHRRAYDNAQSLFTRLTRQSVLPIGLPQAGSISFVVPELVLPRTLRSWSGASVRSIRDHLRGMQTDDAPILLVLGEMGEGKTTILLRQFYDDLNAVRSATENPFPIWVQLSEAFPSAPRTLVQTISSQLSLWPISSRAPFVLYIDGIDEHSSFSFSDTDLRQLSKIPNCRAVILSGRTRFFLNRFSADELKTVCADVLEVTSWDRPIANQFADNYIRKASPSSERWEMLNRRFVRLYNSILLRSPDLVTNPLFLTMILALLCTDRLKEGDNATVSILYKQVITLLVDRECDRLQRAAADHAALLAKWSELAWYLFSTDRAAIAWTSTSYLSAPVALSSLGIAISDEPLFLLLLQYQKIDDGQTQVHKFIHNSFFEYLVANRTIEFIQKWLPDTTLQARTDILSYPVDEGVALFLKDILEQLPLATKRRVASRLEEIYTSLDFIEAPDEGEIACLNATLYMLGRMEYEAATRILLRVWHERKIEIAERYPQAYVTLLSGLSLGDAFDAELEYVTDVTRDSKSIVAKTLVGWHLIYYRDVPTAPLSEYIYTVRDLIPEKWLKSKSALMGRIASDAPRDVRLRPFYLCALWALARNHNTELTANEHACIQKSLRDLVECYRPRARVSDRLAEVYGVTWRQ